MYGNKEITLQVYSNEGNDLVTFTLQPIGTAFKWALTCDYYVETMNPAIHVITGNNIGSNYYYAIDNPPNYSLPDNFKFLLGLSEIKVEVGGSEPNINYFHWDVRDCQYYSPICNLAPSADITLRYDRTNNDIWYFPRGTTNTEEPSEENGWELVNGETKNAWDRVGLTHCPLTPETPTGFILNGNAGSNPILSWNQNTELMLDGYKLYQSINGSSFTHLVTLGKNTTSYVDIGIVIGNKKTDPWVCYRLTAFGRADNESDPTLSKCTRAGSINKEIVFFEISNEILNSKLIEPFPNPFNPKTNIGFIVAEDGDVQISIFNLLGEQEKILVNEYKYKGEYQISFDGSQLASGNYLLTYKINDYLESKLITLLK